MIKNYKLSKFYPERKQLTLLFYFLVHISYILKKYIYMLGCICHY